MNAVTQIRELDAEGVGREPERVADFGLGTSGDEAAARHEESGKAR